MALCVRFLGSVCSWTPKSKQSKMEFPYLCSENCFSTKVTSSSVFKPLREFEPTTVREAGRFVRLLEDDTFSFCLKLFHCIMPRVHNVFSQLQRRTIDSVFVRGIMLQFTQLFWLQRTLFHTSNSRPPNYKATTSSAEGIACAIWLANMDAKILKILALRLEVCIPTLIHPDQVGFVKGWSSADNLRRLLHLVWQTRNSMEPGVAFSLDAEKAFDRVEWEYLFAILERLHVGDVYIKWVKLLYGSPKAAVLTNGPIRNHVDVKGIVSGQEEHKLLLYVDDILLLSSNPEIAVPHILSMICSFSFLYQATRSTGQNLKRCLYLKYALPVSETIGNLNGSHLDWCIWGSWLPHD